MKLHMVDGSPNCRKVLATVNALDIDIEVRRLDFTAGDLSKPEYVATNPNRMVPTLEDGEFKLWESNAIMQYLAAGKPGNTLYPADIQTRADIARWQCWDLAHFGRAVATVTFEKMLKPRFFNAQPDAAVVEQATGDFHRFAPVLNAQLEGRQFILGETLTLADYSVVAPLVYAEAADVPWQPYPHIRAWYQRVVTEPAWARATPPS